MEGRPGARWHLERGTDATKFRYTGHERDAESRLDYMLERSYAYETGRFLRPDPMQNEYPGISPYANAANNSLKYVDPDGRIVLPALYVAEVSSTGYDAYNLYETIQDPKSTKTDVGMAVVDVHSDKGHGRPHVDIKRRGRPETDTRRIDLKQ